MKDTNQPYKKIIFKLFLVVLIIMLSDQAAGLLLRYFYFRESSGVGHHTTYSIKNTSEEIIILGSSRANRSYVPDVFGEKLGKSCYNAGRDGCYLLYNYAVFTAITERYTPEMVIFDINPDDLAFRPSEYDRLSMLLPYYRDHPEIRRILDRRGPFERIKHISAVYPYNSMLLQIMAGNLEYNKQRLPENLKGYMPLYQSVQPGQTEISDSTPVDTLDHGNVKRDLAKTQALEDIITISDKKNIRLIFVFSPIRRIIGNNDFADYLSHLSATKGLDITVLDHSNDSVFINNPSWFADINHLNDTGARIFSSVVAGEIGAIISAESN